MGNTYTYRASSELKLYYMQLAALVCCCFFSKLAFGQSAGNAFLHLRIAEVQGLNLTAVSQPGLTPGSAILSDINSAVLIKADLQLNLTGNSAVLVSQSVYSGADVLNLLRYGLDRAAVNDINKGAFAGKRFKPYPLAGSVFSNRRPLRMKVGNPEKQVSCLLVYDIYPL